MIDADALKKEFPKDSDWEYPVNTNEYVCEKIDEQPTIEERKKGRWQEDLSGYGFWICSACGFVSEASCADLLYNFCPNCGADMRCDSDE